MSVDHDRQTANYCSQCGSECEGVDVVTIGEDFLAQGLIQDDAACVSIEESVLRIFHHAEGSE